MRPKSPEINSQTAEHAQQAHDILLKLGEVALKFAGVERAPRRLDGSRENDSEHSFHLAISAMEIAANFYPDLNVGLVSQFSIVHDLPELYVGDIWTFGISDEDRIEKELSEEEATLKLLEKLPPHTAQLLRRYMQQKEPEARLVRFVDKLTPIVSDILTSNAAIFKEDFGINNLEELNIMQDTYAIKLQSMFPEFSLIHIVHSLISNTRSKHLFGES